MDRQIHLSLAAREQRYGLLLGIELIPRLAVRGNGTDPAARGYAEAKLDERGRRRRWPRQPGLDVPGLQMRAQAEAQASPTSRRIGDGNRLPLLQPAPRGSLGQPYYLRAGLLEHQHPARQ